MITSLALIFFLSFVHAAEPSVQLPLLTILRQKDVESPLLNLKFNKAGELMMLTSKKLVIRNLATDKTLEKEFPQLLTKPFLEEVKDRYAMIDANEHVYSLDSALMNEKTKTIVSERSAILADPLTRNQTHDGKFLVWVDSSKKLELTSIEVDKPFVSFSLNEDIAPQFCEPNKDELIVATKSEFIKLNRYAKEKIRLVPRDKFPGQPFIVCSNDLLYLTSHPLGFKLYKTHLTPPANVMCPLPNAWTVSSDLKFFAASCADGLIRIFNDKGVVTGENKHDTSLIDWMSFVTPDVLAYVNQMQLVFIDLKGREFLTANLFHEKRGQKKIRAAVLSKQYIVIELDGKTLHHIQINQPDKLNIQAAQ